MSLTGSFTSYFAGKPVPVRQGEKPRKAEVTLRSPDTRMVVVGDAPFASDMVRYTNAGYNMDFISNCTSWLASEDDLLTIKTRSQVDLRLNRITDAAARARAMLVSQIVSVVLVPLLVVAFGVLRFLRRRGRQAGLDRARDTQ